MIGKDGIDYTACSDPECNNKVYGFDRLSPVFEAPVCLKHYRMYVLGWSEHEAKRGKRDEVEK